MARLRRKYGIRGVIAILANVPVIALLVWGVAHRDEITLDDPLVRWSVVLFLVALIALECWLGYWVFVLMNKEMLALPDVGDQGEEK
jgi:hypothetical protein